MERSGHPALPQLSQTWLGQASTSGNRNLSLKRVVFIRQQLCLPNTFAYVCFQPREDGWGRIINPNLQMGKCSSHLRSGSKILEAGASGEVKLGTEESRLEKGQAWMGRVVEGGCSSPLPKEAVKSLPRALPP